MLSKEELIAQAKKAATFSYSPYSHFKVGACGVFENETGEQKIFTGCNIENAAYGPTNCGERTAIFTAVAQGYKKLIAMYVYTPTQTVSPPCGVCRQVMNEFGPECLVVSSCDNLAATEESTLDQLLPGAFGPGNLGR